MNYETLKIEKRAGYAVLFLNRPDKLNALNNQLFTELNSAIIEIEKDSEINGLIITGTGEKAFAAGADISELNKCDGITGKHFSHFGSQVFSRLENMQIPVIAAVNGFSLGGGCELALACHIRYASENAKFGQPEVNLGILPGYGGTQRLPRIIGKSLAMELILSGNIISAADALACGLVSKVFPQVELLAKTEELMQTILSKGIIAVKASLDAVNQSDRLSLQEGLLYESMLFGRTCGSEDFKEGTTAFLEKRKAEFKNK